MDSVTFDIQGFDKIFKKFKQLDAKAKGGIKEEFAASALTIQSNAKKNVVVDTGFLRNSIFTRGQGAADSFIYTIGARSKYAAYVEFGTGGLVSIPNGYEDLASMYKGRGIRKINLRARPYLIPAFEQEKPKLIQRLKKLLNA